MSEPQKNQEPVREYEKSGLYPENGKSFRILALLGWIGVVVVFLAIAAGTLDYLLIQR